MTETQSSILADRSSWFDVRVVPSAHPGSSGWSVVLRIDGDYTDHDTALNLAEWFAELLSVRHVAAGSSSSQPAKFPRLPAYPRTDGVDGLRVWCGWCSRWHVHGPGYGHRVAHCHIRTSPYRITGYVLASPAVLERKAQP